MTKKEMKETIRQRINEEWDDLKFITREFGIESYEAKRRRQSWIVLDDLWNDLFPTEDWRY